MKGQRTCSSCGKIYTALDPHDKCPGCRGEVVCSPQHTCVECVSLSSSQWDELLNRKSRTYSSRKSNPKNPGSKSKGKAILVPSVSGVGGVSIPTKMSKTSTSSSSKKDPIPYLSSGGVEDSQSELKRLSTKVDHILSVFAKQFDPPSTRTVSPSSLPAFSLSCLPAGPLSPSKLKTLSQLV